MQSHARKLARIRDATPPTSHPLPYPLEASPASFERRDATVSHRCDPGESRGATPAPLKFPERESVEEGGRGFSLAVLSSPPPSGVSRERLTFRDRITRGVGRAQYRFTPGRAASRRGPEDGEGGGREQQQQQQQQQRSSSRSETGFVGK